MPDRIELRDPQQETVVAGGLADEIVRVWLGGFWPATSGPDALITYDLIFFRVGLKPVAEG